MRTYLVDVRLDGSMQHVVSNKIVTVPEIAVLKVIHGADAIQNVRPRKAGGKDILDARSDEDLRRDLRKRYDKDERKIVDVLFGVHGKLPTSLKQIGIDPAAEAAALRAAAEQSNAAAAALLDQDGEGDLDDMFDEDETKAA